jgi:hypothetical protein
VQQDFHFYTIYTLARLAGIEDEKAQIIAYSSQYVDDVKNNTRLNFVDGGSYTPIMTAHKLLGLSVLSEDTFYKIFIPFHFLPGNVQANEFYQKLICLPNSLPAREMIAEVLSNWEKPYFLHWLGIALHAYADTWTHQNFSGVLRRENLVKDLKDAGKIVTSEEHFDEDWMDQTINLIPAVGHGQAGNIPDIPYKKWKYKNYKNEQVQVDNSERFIYACEEIFQIFCLISEIKAQYSWKVIQENLQSIFPYEGNLQQRIANWKKWIKSGIFGFRKENIAYDREIWFKDAVVIVNEKKNIFIRNDVFLKSNWKYFNDAAYAQRLYILHELLPRYGIYCS